MQYCVSRTWYILNHFRIIYKVKSRVPPFIRIINYNIFCIVNLGYFGFYFILNIFQAAAGVDLTREFKKILTRYKILFVVVSINGIPILTVCHPNEDRILS